MTNKERYKTAKERAEAYEIWSRENNPSGTNLAFDWLEREADPEILPCPYCGRQHFTWMGYRKKDHYIMTCDCGYSTYASGDKAEVIRQHNTLVRAAETRDKYMELLAQLDVDVIRRSGDRALADEIEKQITPELYDL